MPAAFQSRLIFGGILLLLIGATTYTFFGNSPFFKASESIACTADAMMCPDGSSVGRVGPNCEFAKCPSADDTSTGSKMEGNTGFDQTLALSGIAVTPLSLLEDSRCPSDVQCIQAGTVRIKASVQTASGTSAMTFGLGTPVIVGNQTLTLIGVYPGKQSKTTITINQYLFTFRISK